MMYNKKMFHDLKNKIDFFIRNKTRFSRKNFTEKNENVRERNYLENLYTIDILDKCIEKTPKVHAAILDIGCKNWFYAKGEYNFFKSFCIDFELDGVEIDAYRLYSNFYSRYETAKYYIKDLKNTNYIAGNVLDINKKYDFIIWFLPFVTPEPHKYWGLPEKLFMPEQLLSHAYKLLKDNGQMLIINQGEKEAQIQKQMLDSLNIKYEEKGIVKSEFIEYKNNRYAYLICPRKIRDKTLPNKICRWHILREESDVNEFFECHLEKVSSGGSKARGDNCDTRLDKK